MQDITACMHAVYHLHVFFMWALTASDIGPAQKSGLVTIPHAEIQSGSEIKSVLGELII